MSTPGIAGTPTAPLVLITRVQLLIPHPFAGIYGVCTLFGVVPPLMAWRARTTLPPLEFDLVPGGLPVLALMASGVSLLILDSLVTQFGF